MLKTKVLVGGERAGWKNFDEEFSLFSTHFYRTEETPCGDDLMLMFFTSGTTGYPKIAAHSYKYALGHYTKALARAYCDKVVPAMTALRKEVDMLETMTSSEYWPVPTYADLMFRQKGKI